MQDLDNTNIKQFLEKHKTFIFDCDGVLWRGHQVIPGVPDTLKMLRDMGKTVIFVTNNSAKSRKHHVEKMGKLGIEVAEDEIFNSGFATAAYLKSINFNKTAYIIGEKGLGEEFTKAGLEWRGIDEHTTFSEDPASTDYIKHDEEIGAVVVGLDRRVTYAKIAFANFHLRENEGCLFVATNEDATFPSANKGHVPGAGAMLSMMKEVCDLEPLVCGKPSKTLFDVIKNKVNFDLDSTVMVGDRLNTDMRFGKDGGISTLIVLSGITTEEEARDPENEVIPDFIVSSIGAIHSLV